MADTTHRLRDDLGYWLFRAFLGIGSRLPLRLLRPVGQLAGSAALRISRRDRRRAMEHVQIAFPDMDRSGHEALLRRSARHLGLTLAEVVWLWQARPDEVDRLCTIEGVEHLEGALAQGGGAVLSTAHCGNWELLNARLGTAGVPMTIVVREVYDQRVDRIATSLRTRFGSEVVIRGHKAGRCLGKALAANRVCGLLIDQDIRDITGVFVPFFGRPAWTPLGVAALSLRAGCPVTPAFIARRPDLTHHARILPPLPVPTSGDQTERVLELTAAATRAIEDQIRAYPEQWVWMHRRWRTRPEQVAAHG
jgi:KDO2-lipid IV(A) lauroyltransferase